MKHIVIDQHDEQVREFIRSLSLEPDGVELELDGQVVCKVIAPHQLSDEERDAILTRGWKLVERTGERNKGVSSKVIEREVNEAVDQVRRRKHDNDLGRPGYERNSAGGYQFSAISVSAHIAGLP
jgi:hypothetical protein